jgi:hypothetical protein
LPIPEGEFESVHAAAMFSQGFACALPKGGGPIECFGDWGDPNPVDEPWVQLTAGTGIVCGLTASCEPQCLGGAPGTRPPDGARFVQLAASSRQRCGVHFDGTVECWGYDGFDHLYYEPFGDDLFTRVSVGDWLICGLRTDGTLACIPSPEAEDSDVPDPPDGAFAEVSIGRTHACALGLDDEVVCWGSNDMGESSPP